MTNGRLAYDPAGRVFAIACGSEILAHDGETEAPLWKRDHGEEVAAIEAAGDEIVALLASGSIVRHGLKDGREAGRVGLSRPAHALAVGAGDFTATVLDHDGVSALAFSGDASKLLLGTREGALVELTRPERAGAGRTLAAEAPVAAIAWSPKGGWLIGAGDRVLRLEPGAEKPAHVTRAGGQAISDVAVSLDGRRIAMEIGDQLVAVLEDPPKETLAQLRYPERRVHGVRFGPGDWIAVALDTGDANKLDVVTGAVHRSDTHPGREHHSWLVAASVPALEARAAKQAERKPAARAAPAPVSYEEPPQPQDDGPSPMLVLRIVIAVIFFLLALVRIMSSH